MEKFKFIPKCVAPNLITVCSLLSALSQYLLLTYYDYDFFASTYELPDSERVPKWIWLYSSISIIICIVLDAVDGKHARNIGACSPIGELLDHGVDTWRLMAPMLSCVFCIFGRGYFGLLVNEMAYLLLALQSAVVITLWQQYLTKIMYYNWTYDITQYYLIGFYFKTYLEGGSDWWQCDGYFFGSNAKVIEKSLYILLGTISIGQQISYFYKRYRVKALELRNPILYSPLCSPVILTIITYLWLNFSPSGIAEYDPRAFLWVTSMIFSNLMWRLVLGIMTNSKITLTTGFLNLYVFVIVCILLAPSLNLEFELWILRCLAIFATLYHLHYVTCTVRQISRRYKISIFTVKNNHLDSPARD